MTDTPRVLLLSIDQVYSQNIANYLEANGCKAYATHDVQEFYELIHSFSPRIVIIDQKLGDTTGTEALRRLRSQTSIPCIIIDDQPDLTDVVVNLEIGADDEIEKTTNPREFIARIRSVLRRNTTPTCSSSPPIASSQAQAGRWRFILDRRELIRPDGSPCKLTSAEFETLRILYEAAGKTVSRASLCERVFGRPFRPTDRAIDTVVKKIREKLEPGLESRCIKTVRPLGYVFTGFPDAIEEQKKHFEDAMQV